MLAVASQTGFIYTHNVDPCLKGFTQTIPPVEEWGNYAVLDVKGGSFLYPELMFRCNGTVTRITIPYSTVHGILWDNVLELRIVIWRRQGRLGYVEGKGIIAMTPVITTASYAATTQGNRRGNTTNNSTIKIERNDILQFIVLQNGKYGRREHIPVLLRENTESCTPLGCPLVPMVHVDFTCSESSKSKHSTVQYVHFTSIQLFEVLTLHASSSTITTIESCNTVTVLQLSIQHYGYIMLH